MCMCEVKGDCEKARSYSARDVHRGALHTIWSVSVPECVFVFPACLAVHTSLSSRLSHCITEISFSVKAAVETALGEPAGQGGSVCLQPSKNTLCLGQR